MKAEQQRLAPGSFCSQWTRGGQRTGKRRGGLRGEQGEQSQQAVVKWELLQGNTERYNEWGEKLGFNIKLLI